MKKVTSLLMSVVLLLSMLTGMSFTVYAEEATIALGETKTITLAVDETLILSFTPEEDGYYYFYSTGEFDTYCYLYADGEEIGNYDDEFHTYDEEDEDDINWNFGLGSYFSADVEYTFEIGVYSEYGIDEYSVNVTLSDTAPDGLSDSGVVSISFTPANYITFYAGVPDYYYENEDDGVWYYCYTLYTPVYTEGNILVVNYLNGDTVFYTSEYVTYYDEEEDEEYSYLYYVPDNEDYDSIEFYSLDYGELVLTDYTLGEYDVTVGYAGCSAKITVELVENPVESIEYTSNTVLKEGIDSYVYTDYDGSTYDLYFYTPDDGDVLTVNYKDQTAVEYTAVYVEECDYDDYEHVHFVSPDGDVLHLYEDFSIESSVDSSGNEFTVGVNTTTAEYMGSVCEFEFTIESSNITSITATPDYDTVALGEDSVNYGGYVYYYCPSFTLTVTYDDDTQEDIRVNREYDEDYEYYYYVSESGDLYVQVESEQDYDDVQWLSGEEHQFDVYLSARLHDTIDVTVVGECEHENTELCEYWPASCDEDGYTGDLVCQDCGEVISEGEVIPCIDSIKLSRTSITYTGTVQRPTVTVTDSEGNALTYKEDFTVDYSNWNSKNAGTYTVTIDFIGDYDDSVTRTYKIVPQTNVTPVLNRTTITMNGTVQRPTVTVTDKYGNKLTYKKDFTVDYSNWSSTAVGRYTVTVTMMGNYSGTKTYAYYINPKSTTITSVTGISKGFTVKWNKQTNSTTGYQIQYATKSDFSNAATIYAGASSATSKTITGRAAKTKYYVRIRTYKNIGGKYFYSDWSSAKTVTTK